MDTDHVDLGHGVDEYHGHGHDKQAYHARLLQITPHTLKHKSERYDDDNKRYDASTFMNFARSLNHNVFPSLAAHRPLNESRG